MQKWWKQSDTFITRLVCFIMISKALSNIILSQSVSTEPAPQLGEEHVRVQVVVIDFGMATLLVKINV